MRNAVEEIAGAIQRIDHPARLCRVALDHPALFQHKAPVGPRDAQLVIQGALGSLIGLRDEIGRALAGHLQMFDFTKIATQTLPGLAGSFFHHADQTGYC